MLKINLLPPYINQAGKIRSAWIAMAVLLLVELVGLSVYQAGLRKQEDDLNISVQSKEQEVARVQKIASDAAAKRAEIEPIRLKTKFINEIRTFNRERPDLYDHVAAYIYREVWIQSMQAEQNVLTMAASASTISAVGRFLLFMQNNPDFTKVQVSSVPGWPPGTGGVEASPLSGEAASTDAAGGTGGMMPGGPGMMPGGGMPGMMRSAPEAAPAVGTASPAASPGGGPPGYGAPGGGPGAIFGGGAIPGGGDLSSVTTPGGEINYGGAPIPLPQSIARPKVLPTYFPFTVTAVLVKTIKRPYYEGGPPPEGESGPGATGATPGSPPGYAAPPPG